MLIVANNWLIFNVPHSIILIIILIISFWKEIKVQENRILEIQKSIGSLKVMKRNWSINLIMFTKIKLVNN